MRVATLAAVLALAAPAAAAAATPASDDPSADAGQVGVLFDFGLPEGASLSATFRPTPSVRFFAGPAWNYVGWGVQGGLTLAPWHWRITPVLTVEGGRCFGANVSFLTRRGQGVPEELDPLLGNMTYTYGAILLGLEFGSQRGFTFALDAGLSYVALAARGTVRKDAGSGNVVTFKDPAVRATLPSLKFGLHYWF